MQALTTNRNLGTNNMFFNNYWNLEEKLINMSLINELRSRL